MVGSAKHALKEGRANARRKVCQMRKTGGNVRYIRGRRNVLEPWNDLVSGDEEIVLQHHADQRRLPRVPTDVVRAHVRIVDVVDTIVWRRAQAVLFHYT